MALRPLALVAVTCLLAGSAGAATWHPVPGATEVEVDLASIDVDAHRVTAWVRWWGRSPLVPELAGLRAARIHRTAVQGEFDCSRRTLRTLAAQAHDGRGAAVFLSSVPGLAQPIRDEELQWVYDALCEAVRSGARF